MAEEIWKEIENYPGYYVSNRGRVRSTRQRERILRAAPDTYGYPIVRLCNACGKKTRTVHRLVAQAFIPNPENKKEVDHINTIRNDNRVENLRWTTRSENANNPISISNYKNMTTIYSALEKIKRPVIQMLDGKIIAEYNSIREAERATGIKHQCINYVLCGRCHVAGGFEWEYKNK